MTQVLTVESYYADLNQKRFRDAFSLIGPTWRGQIQYQQWETSVNSAVFESVKVMPTGGVRYKVALVVGDRSAKGGATSQISGSWQVVQNGRGGWLLDDPKFAKVSGSDMPHSMADPDVATGEDVSLRGRYAHSSCDIVTDKQNNRMWILGPDRNVTWSEAKAWVQALRACGHVWRLPTIDELAKLYDPRFTAGTGYYKDGVHYPAHIHPAFSAIGAGSWVWSNETVGASSAKSFNFNQDVATTYDRDDTTYSTRVFAVRDATDAPEKIREKQRAVAVAPAVTPDAQQTAIALQVTSTDEDRAIRLVQRHYLKTLELIFGAAHQEGSDAKVLGWAATRGTDPGIWRVTFTYSEVGVHDGFEWQCDLANGDITQIGGQQVPAYQ